MKTSRLSGALFLAALIVMIVTMPGRASGDTLSLVSSWDRSTLNQSGADNTLQIITGVIHSLGGPDLYPVADGYASVTGTQMTAFAPSSSILDVSFWAVWDYGSTQTTTCRSEWASIYSVNGSPGESADVTLNYTYNNHRINLTADGRSESKSDLYYYWTVLPSSNTDSAESIANRHANAPYLMLSYSILCMFDSSYCSLYDELLAYMASFNGTSDSYDANYHFAAFTWSEDSKNGSIDLGTVPVGYELFVGSILLSEAQAQVYDGAVTVTVENAKTESELTATLIPAVVPEPGSIFLLGTSLAGFAGFIRRRRNR